MLELQASDYLLLERIGLVLKIKIYHDKTILSMGVINRGRKEYSLPAQWCVKANALPSIYQSLS